MEIRKHIDTDLWFCFDLKDEKDFDLVHKAEQLFNEYWEKNGVKVDMIKRGLRVEVNINYEEHK